MQQLLAIFINETLTHMLCELGDDDTPTTSKDDIMSMLGKYTDAEVARRAGVSRQRISYLRKQAGIKSASELKQDKIMKYIKSVWDRPDVTIKSIVKRFNASERNIIRLINKTAQENPELTSRRFGRRSVVGNDEFVDAWNNNTSVEAVAREIGYSIHTTNMRARRIRQSGIELRDDMKWFSEETISVLYSLVARVRDKDKIWNQLPASEKKVLFSNDKNKWSWWYQKIVKGFWQRKRSREAREKQTRNMKDYLFNNNEQ